MQAQVGTYSLPRWRVTRWLVDAGPDVPHDIRVALVGHLFGTWPVFVGGVVNTLAVSGIIAARMASAPFIAWFILEIVICLSRLIVLAAAERAARRGGKTPTDIYLLLGLAWSASVGYGVLASLASGDWVTSTLACLSAAAMVGGICFRNFSAPRFTTTMIAFSLGLCLPGAALAGEPLLYLVFLQAPIYMFAMCAAAFKLNKMLIATMRAERENEHRARHDPLTGLWNRTGLMEAARGRDTAFALLFLDLDGFKAVNDTYGHAAGDRLLKMVAERLSRTLGPAGVAARIGGDEFVVSAERVTREQAIALGQQLIAAVATSYDLGDGLCPSIGVSVGIGMAPEHGTALEDLLAVSDAALYEAKSSGKSRCWMASPTTQVAALRRLREHGDRRKTGSVGVAA
jgi:diguanylate cyclase